ncbi:MAG: hypothetical protein P1U36_00455 [Legionellaceae bacterium]|nr:hypothetical protein [Legionellaceae bacterium]
MLIALGRNTVSFSSSAIPLEIAINITKLLSPSTILVLPDDLPQPTVIAVAQTLDENRTLFIPPEMPQATVVAAARALGVNRTLFLAPDMPEIKAMAAQQALGMNRTLRFHPNTQQKTNRSLYQEPEVNTDEIKAGVSALLAMTQQKSPNIQTKDKSLKRNRMFNEKNCAPALEKKTEKRVRFEPCLKPLDNVDSISLS